MTIPKNATVATVFRCDRLNGTLTYKTCILRQKKQVVIQAMQDSMIGHVECISCPEGKLVIERFGEQQSAFGYADRRRKRRPGAPKGVKNGVSLYSSHTALKAEKTVKRDELRVMGKGGKKKDTNTGAQPEGFRHATFADLSREELRMFRGMK